MTVNTNHNAALPLADFRPALWKRWVALRNGDLAYAEEIVAPVLALHVPDGPGRAVAEPGWESNVRGLAGWEPVRPDRDLGSRAACAGGRRAALSWIRAARAALPAGRLTVQVGPIINGDLIAGRWVIYREDLPGQPTGPALVTGTDILRVDDGQVVELWVNHDAASQVVSAEAVAA